MIYIYILYIHIMGLYIPCPGLEVARAGSSQRPGGRQRHRDLRGAAPGRRAAGVGGGSAGGGSAGGGGKNFRRIPGKWGVHRGKMVI